jgi:DNA helicase HerA-like ATPase
MKNNQNQAYIAQARNKELYILPQMANRHGLIAGATGTGKTVSLQNLAETFSQLGVSVFMTDIKGDLSGISKSGGANSKVTERVDDFKLIEKGFQYEGFPVCFFDVFGEAGHPFRTTISEMGPLLLSRLFDLNDTQSGVLSLIFKIADDNGLLLIDMKDLREMVKYVGDNRSRFTTQYGNISAAGIGVIQRVLLQLEEQGGDKFFGEPAFNVRDLMQTDISGRGMVNILTADRLMQSPRIYSTLLLWLLSELFEVLPEVGDLDKPKLIFFFDEAHLLFNEAPKALLEKIEQVVRLIRSKGVGIYFVTQNPIDIPDAVLGQLGNRIQHALRAFTPRDQKAVKSAAGTFRVNPDVNVEKEITELGVGEALISFLDVKGIPTPVERAFVLPPQGQIGPITDDERNNLIRKSLIFGMYEKEADRESAYEILRARAEKQTEEMRIRQQQKTSNTTARRGNSTNEGSLVGGILGDLFGEVAKQTQRSVTRNIGNQLGRQIVRGILGGIFGKK